MRHVQSRFEAFRFSATVKSCADVDPCDVHMRKWILEGAQAADAAAALRNSLPVVLPATSPQAERPGAPVPAPVADLANLGQEARLPEETVSALHAELAALGVAHVAELEAGDWGSMAAFQSLQKFEQRRLPKAVRPA